MSDMSNTAGNRPRAELPSATGLENEMGELGCLVSYDEPDREAAQRSCRKRVIGGCAVPRLSIYTN